jgi:hypothetical protein
MVKISLQRPSQYPEGEFFKERKYYFIELAINTAEARNSYSELPVVLKISDFERCIPRSYS